MVYHLDMLADIEARPVGVIKVPYAAPESFNLLNMIAGRWSGFGLKLARAI